MKWLIADSRGFEPALSGRAGSWLAKEFGAGPVVAAAGAAL